MDVAYPVAREILRAPLTYGLKWTVEGSPRIPTRGPVILASNHTSYLDPLALAYIANLAHRKVRFLAKAELFDKRPLGTLLRQAKQIPVVRDSSSAAGSLEAAVAALEAGECVTVFPEGTISLDLEPMAGKTGTARLAAMTGVSVCPVGMWGAHRIMFKGRKPQWKWGIAEVAVVGDHVRVSPDDDPAEATDRIMGAIAACVARAREVYPQTPGPDDDGWWVRGPETAVVRAHTAVDTS